jgi:hypothetical protein
VGRKKWKWKEKGNWGREGGTPPTGELKGPLGKPPPFSHLNFTEEVQTEVNNFNFNWEKNGVE